MIIEKLSILELRNCPPPHKALCVRLSVRTEDRVYVQPHPASQFVLASSRGDSAPLDEGAKGGLGGGWGGGGGRESLYRNFIEH